MKKDKFTDTLIFVWAVIALWLSVTSIIQRFHCPQMTETELLMNTHHYFFLDFRCR